MADLLDARSIQAPNDGAIPRAVYQIQPLQDSRWAGFVDGHERSSVFHTLRGLKRSTELMDIGP